MEGPADSPSLHNLGTWMRGGRHNPPLAGQWATRWIEIPMWTIVEGGSAAAQPGDIVGERISYSNASGHVGIIVGPQQTVSADSTANPPGLITISDYGFRSDDDRRDFGHAKNCTIRRFACPDPPR
jgi:cell wall-associated NlpC family hydrolase